jgi:NAD(P)-dependent dehydrogenase (short-subunit alcohol dehydrogenase family)
LQVKLKQNKTMSKKTILITGTSTGFGKLTALTLAKAGYNVIATMRNLSNKNKDAAEHLSAIPGIEVVEMDVTSDESVNRSVGYALSKYGAIDVLVNNAGVSGVGLLEAYSIDQLKSLFETNVYGVLRTYKAVLPSMRARREGLIINISSGLGLFASPYVTAYCASKFAVEAFTEGLSGELSPFGIENVSIQCGAYPTEIGSKAGVNADENAVIESYGVEKPSLQTLFGKVLAKAKEFNMDPQVIADGILDLIQMEKGTRPQKYPLDAVAQGADHEYIQSREAIKGKWRQNHQ